ncbi:Crp/Fnr family transcriptional regulator [Mucilaginibacter ginkgonis]|uniref:Crp/Fnr family transcriptional regulator n=1 Tax=Mucilaginibacter ginkgonis TaxID=2682091 RepID=A0A6I4HZ04_9SPHI|nr:Crp/Fnr family transcriptional regulator [Mucilaginibacter ginkgonis]QQL48574.1 Crp/Fnr family transcriptional regulator [Mucilaginibacter ginkgonis]
MHASLKQYLDGKIMLSPADEEYVDCKFKPRSTKRNEILVEKGDTARHIYFVVKGCLRVFLISDAGNESTRFLIFEGRMGTAFPSFINQRASVAAVQSIEASEILMLSHSDRELLLKNILGWERMERVGIEQDYIASIERIESFLSMDAKDRYAILLRKSPEIVKRLPAKIVADYLGISQETLSRLKAKN